MPPSEIVLPLSEPETEWVRGRALQKVSPTRSHALLQRVLASALSAWAGPRGEVGTEWRFRVAPTGEPARPLVPDIAYVAVEVLSPGDRRADVDDKIATYLAAGSLLVMIVDAPMRTVELHDAAERVALHDGQYVRHRYLPGFELSVYELFDQIAPPR